jgi:gliding motility-associated-like protein
MIEPEANNAFSPNGDGINDHWVIKNLELFPDNELVVINRWGNEVLTQRGYANDWNGSDLGEGTYFYILKVDLCDEEKVYDGYVTILR